MTRRRPFGSVLSRAVLGLLVAGATVAAVALVTPVAQATPETDAGDAINAAWQAAGGDGSPLGPRDGDIYAVGPGFGQNFATGAIYFSPGTGARAMFGAILEKYRALGGPADSDLGFPNIDEGPGKVSPESRNSTFSAGDNPVIFWTPETGAWVVRGPINAAWDKLGGSAGPVGVPVSDETYNGDVVSQKFTGGQLSFDTRTKTFSTEPPDLAGQLAGLNVPSDATSAIAMAWRAAGGQAGVLGAKKGDQFPIGDNGVGQEFAGGKVFYTPDTGAHAVTGAILADYEKAGGPTGDLGFPNSTEADGGVPDSRISTFAAADDPAIFWTKEHGAFIVRGAMKAAWDKLGGATGALGVPVGNQNTEDGTVSQKFSGGEVSWNGVDNTFKTDPANLGEQLSGLQVPTAPPSVTPAAPPAGEKDNKFAWKNWWLWWIVPLAVLLIGSLYAWALMRRRRGRVLVEADDEVEVTPGYDPPHDSEYGEAPADNGHWAPRGELADGSDRDDAGAGYLAPRTTWADRDAPSPRYGDRGPDLFTHHGDHQDVAVAAAHDLDDDLDDQDAVDTAPTKIPVVQAEAEDESGRHSRGQWSTPDDDAYLPSGPGSLFTPFYDAPPREEYPEEAYDDPAEPADEPDEDWDDEPTGQEPAQHDGGAPPAIHLPLDDPNQAPPGYPVKGVMRTGEYHTPGSRRFQETVAEIWFASAELAEANGFAPAE